MRGRRRPAGREPLNLLLLVLQQPVPVVLEGVDAPIVIILLAEPVRCVEGVGGAGGSRAVVGSRPAGARGAVALAVVAKGRLGRAAVLDRGQLAGVRSVVPRANGRAAHRSRD